jgi:hypothetical protein
MVSFAAAADKYSSIVLKVQTEVPILKKSEIPAN